MSQSQVKADQVRRAVKDIVDAAYFPIFPIRKVTTPVAKQLLLKSNFVVNGTLYQFQAKSLGCGVYEIKRVEVE
jgi:hypothetical protein